jgi:sialic acid synthase SpsE
MIPKDIISVDNFDIGGDKTYIIAEVGSNHCQDLNLAKEHISIAKDCGANAVKFQSLNVSEQYYQPDKKIIDLHKKIDFEESWHYELNEYAKTKGITFFSSPTYFNAIDILENINISVYKLASAQIGTFPQIVKRIAATQKPVIFSTGLVSYGEIEKIVKIFEEANNSQYMLLHCNSVYPTPFDKVGLNLMQTYKQMFGCIVGFSDHTLGTAVPIGAVALGAKIIEKHFVLDVNLPSPDAPNALEPIEFKQMVQGIRAIEQAVSTNFRTQILPDEQAFKDRILCKLILNKDVFAGDFITELDFDFKRAPGGVNCKDLDNIIGKQYKTDLKNNTVLTYNDI